LNKKIRVYNRTEYKITFKKITFKKITFKKITFSYYSLFYFLIIYKRKNINIIYLCHVCKKRLSTIPIPL